MTQATAFLSIGSNKGDKAENLDRAVRALREKDRISVDVVSFYYRTEPQNFTDQDWFVNAALKVRTGLDPEPLLDLLKQIEKELDKEGKPFRFGPRIIDLDIVYYNDLILKTDRLVLPHPRMHERCFVLKPICDIGAKTIHPVLKKRTDELLNEIEHLENQQVIRLQQGETH